MEEGTGDETGREPLWAHEKEIANAKGGNEDTHTLSHTLTLTEVGRRAGRESDSEIGRAHV